jgi:hypothetical protein
VPPFSSEEPARVTTKYYLFSEPEIALTIIIIIITLTFFAQPLITQRTSPAAAPYITHTGKSAIFITGNL